MKNLSTLQQTAPGDLKLAYSKSMANITRIIAIQERVRLSPYRTLFIVHPVVQQPTSWDNQWFGNYE